MGCKTSFVLCAAATGPSLVILLGALHNRSLVRLSVFGLQQHYCLIGVGCNSLSVLSFLTSVALIVKIHNVLVSECIRYNPNYKAS